MRIATHAHARAALSQAGSLLIVLRSDRGDSLVELALLLPILTMLLVGTVDLGRLAYMSIEVANAARA
jgi:Flp pilus assembly protein TadG